MRSHLIGWTALTIVILASATFSSFAKQLSEVLSPLSLLFVGEIFIVFFVLLSFGAFPIIQELRKLQTRHIFPLLGLSLLVICGLLLWFTALKTTEAANAELFGRSEMLFLLLLAWLFLREPLTRTHALAGLAIAIGTAIVALRGFEESLTLHRGDFLIIFGTFNFSLGSIIFKRYLHDLPPELVLFVRSGIAVAIFFLLSPFIEHQFIEEIQELPLSLIPVLLSFGFVSRFLSVFSFYTAADHLPISTISLFAPMGTIAGVLFAHIYLGEPLFWYHYIGGSFTILGALLMSLAGLHPSEENLKSHMKLHHRHHL